MNSTDIAFLALIVSAVSLLVAGLSLGWNIYKEVALRGRVRVQLSVVNIIQQGADVETRVRIGCTNYGPGSVKLMSLGCTFVKFSGGKTSTGHGMLMHGWDHPGTSQLPRTLEQGENATYLIGYSKDSFLSYDLQTVFVIDSFDRKHFASRREVQTARVQFVSDFVSGKGASPKASIG